MMLRDNPNIKLPSFSGGSFGGMNTHRTGALNDLVLEKVEETESGDLRLSARIEGTEQKLSDSIKFLEEKRSLKDALYKWLTSQTEKTIDSIYRSEFNYERGDK